MNKKLQTAHTYTVTAERMASKFNGSGPRVMDIERVFSYMDKPDPFIFEIGCGNGRDAAEILRRTSHYCGIDISEGMVMMAKQNTSEGDFQVGDVDHYKFPPEIDIVFAFASLLHCDAESVRETFIKAYEALQDNGLFFISVKLGEYQQLDKVDEFGTRTFYFYTPELILQLAGKGFMLCYVDRYIFNGEDWFSILLKKEL